MELVTVKDEKELKEFKELKALKDEKDPNLEDIKFTGTGLKMYGRDDKGKIVWIKQYI